MYIVYDLKSKVCSDVSENLNDCFNDLQELDSLQFGNTYRIINIESSKVMEIQLDSYEILKIEKY